MNITPIRILVFPCGSEIGLEVFRSLKYSRHVELIGGSSVDDHGRFVYESYVGDIPFADSPNFEKHILSIVSKHQIDAIYPTMDSVITKLTGLGEKLGCKVIGSPHETNLLVLSKGKTYSLFQGKIPVPKVFDSISDDLEFPIFSKPDVGYGSQGTQLLRDKIQAEVWIKENPTNLLMEYLPGSEYTVDCFTNREGDLLFSEPRARGRIQKGISVNTYRANNQVKEEVVKIAKIISTTIELRGAWFFQVKEDRNGKLSLLEIASRLGGSSSLFRYSGVNFALMSVFDAFGIPVGILENEGDIELDRALNQQLKISLDYTTVYVDLDDCLLLGESVNSELASFLYQCHNRSKRVILITKHEKDLGQTLAKFRIKELFHECIHLKKEDDKSDYMEDLSSIFIDDSFSERKKVKEKLNIPVFAPDAVSGLM